MCGNISHCGGVVSEGNQNWQQVETAADWISCSLPGLRRPFRGVRRVVVPCLRRPASRLSLLGDRRPFRRNWATWHTRAKGYSAQAVKPDVCRWAEIEKKHISSTTVSTRLVASGSPKLSTLRNECIWILWYTTQLWYSFHNSHSILVIAFSSFCAVALSTLLIWMFINLVMRKQTLVPSFTSLFSFVVKLTLERMPLFTRRSRAKYPSNNICTVVEDWHHGCFCLGHFSPSTHLDLVIRLAQLRKRGSVCSGFCARSWVSWRKLHQSPCEHWPFPFQWWQISFPPSPPTDPFRLFTTAADSMFQCLASKFRYRSFWFGDNPHEAEPDDDFSKLAKVHHISKNEMWKTCEEPVHRDNFTRGQYEGLQFWRAESCMRLSAGRLQSHGDCFERTRNFISKTLVPLRRSAQDSAFSSTRKLSVHKEDPDNPTEDLESTACAWCVNCWQRAFFECHP